MKILEDKTLNKVNQLNDNLYFSYELEKPFMELAEELKKYGFKLIAGGTDNHLLLIDMRNKGMLGGDAETLLDEAGITVNKNTIPFDPNPPFKPSGIRLGTPAITTRGMKDKEMVKIAAWINEVISNPKSVKKIRLEVKNLCKKFPLNKCKYQTVKQLKINLII